MGFIWKPAKKKSVRQNKAHKLFIICNPHSNRNRHRTLIPLEIKLLEKSGLDFIYAITEKPMDEYHLAREAIKEGYKIIIASGGDSTVSNIADAILSHRQRITFGIIPCGTGNDYATGNKIPTDLHRAIQIIKRGKVARRDVIKIGSRYAVSLVGFGFDITMSEVHLKNKFLKGALLYYYAIIVAIFKHKGFMLNIAAGDGTVFKGKALMLNLGNNKISGGGYMTCPRASMTDGKMDVMFIQDCPPLMRLKLLGLVQKAQHLKHPLVSYTQTKKVTIKSEFPIAFHTEGEMFYTKKKTITAEIIPKRLKLLVP